MNSIELMVYEHTNIIRMLAVVRKASYGVMKGEDINYQDFDKMIDFIANYADVHHHGKEEKFLFKEMVDHLGKMGTNLISHGMLVEHDWGRLFIAELKDALKRVQAGDDESRLDVIANAVGYANHLARHITKEDTVVYTFAEKQLAPEILAQINNQTDAFEAAASQQGVQNFYIEMLVELEQKYL
ncbi:MAG: hemerythrin domain-containing protein [Acetobacterium woodii]|nr:hemerythrin domain-containing protein [Acetobacterium woodii]